MINKNIRNQDNQDNTDHHYNNTAYTGSLVKSLKMVL